MSIEQEITDRAGLESQPERINDVLYYHESPDRGGILINLTSESALEEDISQMERGHTILEKEEHGKIISEAFRDTLKMLGEYFPREKLDRLFPGLDQENLDSYNFVASKIKVYVLNEDDYDFLASNLFPGDNGGSGGFTKPTVSSSFSSTVSSEMHVDMSEKKIIVVNEVGGWVKDEIKRSNDMFPLLVTAEDKNLIRNGLKAKIIHEFLHDLDVATYLPKPFAEGVTEWYAQQVVNGASNENGSAGYKKIAVGYSLETQCVAILVNAVLEGGVESEIIDKAFLSSDPEAKKQLTEFLSNRYGEEEADKILRWRFRSTKEALQYIIGLESKQDSDIGRFLKTFDGR